MSINDNITFSENIKQEFKRKNYWINYRSEITRQTKNNNLDFHTDPIFSNNNRLLVLSLKNGFNVPTINFFYDCYIALVEIKDFNVLIDKKPFFCQPVKSKQKAYEKLLKCQEMMII